MPRLSQHDSDCIGECLTAFAYGPFIPDTDFSTVSGLNRNQIKSVADGWPAPIVDPNIVERAVRSALNNLSGYPIAKPHLEMMSEYISVEREQLRPLPLRYIKTLEADG